MSSPWPKHPNGSPKKIGEMTPGERKEVVARAAQRLQAEADDPTSTFHRALKALLADDAPSQARH